MALALTHFLDQGLGLHSVALMERSRELLAFWRLDGFWHLLLLAIVVHMTTALIGLYRRLARILHYVARPNDDLGAADGDPSAGVPDAPRAFSSAGRRALSLQLGAQRWRPCRCKSSIR